MKRILRAYKDLLGIIFAEAPLMVVLTFAISIIGGLTAPLGVYVNQNIFDGGLAIARGEADFAGYSAYLVLFVLITLLPHLFGGYIWRYVEPRSLLILRTAYKSRMLQKLKSMK